MRARTASTPLRSRPAAISKPDIDRLCVDTIRTLAIDAVEKAQSGHAGTPMGIAPVAYTLWQQFLRYDPADPLWPNRDRFVLSCGHASMLLYALLHLAEVRRVEGGHVTERAAISLDDIKDFRKLDSVTPGHPEYGRTTGVETTTGLVPVVTTVRRTTLPRSRVRYLVVTCELSRPASFGRPQSRMAPL